MPSRSARYSLTSTGCGVCDHRGHPAIINVPIRERSGRLPCRVSIDNDATAAALAEHRSARSRTSTRDVTLGTGIGGGLIIMGELLRGATARSDRPHRDRLRRAPFQATARTGAWRLRLRGRAGAGRARAPRGPPTRRWRTLSEQGNRRNDGHEASNGCDDAALSVVGQAGVASLRPASLANIFEPEVIVIGGGVGKALGERLIDPAIEELRWRALPPMNAVPVQLAELGPEAGMVGAAEMARLELAV